MPIDNQEPDPGAEAPDAGSPPESAETNEPTSVFLTKEQVGKDVKAGDTLTFTVKDIDPQTGEVEAVPAEAGENESAPSESLGESPMDKMDSMPE